MSGPNESNLRAKDKMGVVMAALEDYEKKCGLPAHTPPGEESELNEYLNCGRDVMESYSAIDLAQIAWRLSQYAFYIQREYNRENSRVKWCEAKAYSACAKEFDNYSKFYKHEVKMAAIAADNSYVGALCDLRNYAEQRSVRLDFLSKHLASMETTVKNLQRAKENRERT